MMNNQFITYRIRKRNACELKISRDGIRWERVEIIRLSSCELEFISVSKHFISEKLRIDMRVHCKLSEFKFNFDTHIDSKKLLNNKIYYHLKYDNAALMDIIHLEEIIFNQADVFEPEHRSDSHDLANRLQM